MLAGTQILGSARLRLYYSAVLAVGNTLNSGTAYGNAAGIRVESLQKLSAMQARAVDCQLHSPLMAREAGVASHGTCEHVDRAFTDATKVNTGADRFDKKAKIASGLSHANGGPKRPAQPSSLLDVVVLLAAEMAGPAVFTEAGGWLRAGLPSLKMAARKSQVTDRPLFHNG